MAADAHAKLTGRVGVCMVTRGPGATNASAGVHIAFQDSTPMILFIGQVARTMIEREAFQEIDYRRMFGQMAKWVTQIDDPARIQEYISRAYRTALSGRPGPVVIALPEDMLYDDIITPPPAQTAQTPRFLPAPDAMTALQAAINTAKRPLIMAGGGGWTTKGIAALERFAEVQGLPVATSFRCQSLMNNDHPNYVGHCNVAPSPYLNAAIAETDLLIAIGPRLGEMTTQGYTLMDSPVPSQKLAHVFPDGDELGRVYEPENRQSSWPARRNFVPRSRPLHPPTLFPVIRSQGILLISRMFCHGTQLSVTGQGTMQDGFTVSAVTAAQDPSLRQLRVPWGTACLPLLLRRSPHLNEKCTQLLGMAAL